MKHIKSKEEFFRLNENDSFDYSFGYDRVIPRDFFNESKLLKCYGQISLMIQNDQMAAKGIDIEIIGTDSGEEFRIQQTENGGITIANYPVRIGSEQVLMYTKKNSKDAYPMMCLGNDWEEVEVFNSDGSLSQEFIEKYATQS